LERKELDLMPYDTTIPGWMTVNELKVIESWAKNVEPNGVIVEVGSFLGRSAYCWCRSTDPTVTVYCIDTFDDRWTDISINDNGDIETNGHGEPRKTTKKTLLRQQTLWEKYTKDLTNMIQLKGYCPTDVVYPNNDIDILFLDAAHENPNDWDVITAHLPKLKPNSRICGHDYNKTEYPDVMVNAKRLEQLYNKSVTLYPKTSLWMIQI
jgi:hypothetical protein